MADKETGLGVDSGGFGTYRYSRYISRWGGFVIDCNFFSNSLTARNILSECSHNSFFMKTWRCGRMPSDVL